jgi:hypothetical protein
LLALKAFRFNAQLDHSLVRNIDVTSPFSVMYRKLRMTCGVLVISVAATMAVSASWMYDSDQPVRRVSGCMAPKPNAQRLVLAFCWKRADCKAEEAGDGQDGGKEEEREERPAAVAGRGAPLEVWTGRA